MSLFVLALGVLMSLVGVILLATGYPVIEVERGWASVISGATLLAGGVVTAALGLLLRAVGSLQTTFLDARAVAPSPVAAVPPRAEPDMSELPSFRDAEPALAHPDPAARPAEEPPETALEPPVSDAPVAVAPPSHDVLAEGPETPTPPVVRLPPVAQPPRPESAAAVLPEPAETEATTAPTEPDWLDRSFAELDRENTDLAAHAPTEPALPAEPPVEAHHQEPRPPAAEAAHAGHAAGPNSAIIGRYEADGTSYVMYADGSIEASSPAGVYRFASMAELKSFIEG